MTPPKTPEGFITLLGGFPERPPLDAEVLEVAEFEDYTRQLVEYTTEGTERVQAFLLIPKGLKSKVPGVLAIHQDGDKRPYTYGKSEPAGVGGDPELAYGLELCRRGYVVICPDRLPFESRSVDNSPYREIFEKWRLILHYEDENGRQELDFSGDAYANCIAVKLLYEGRTLIGKTLFELSRAIDYLCSRPEVEAEKIGSIGHSAGGFYTGTLMYIEPRIKVGASSCGVNLWGSMLEAGPQSPMNAFRVGGAVPGMKHWGDMDDMLAGIAPRPLLEAVGDDMAIADPNYIEALTAKAKAHYAELGVAERFEYDPYGGWHVFRKDKREKSYDWFDKWLKGE